MIGLFDSGYGGLTILHGILDVLPQYSYVYVGDNARAPYGSRSGEEIFEFTKQGVGYLYSHGCELVILACNTASASALRRLQQEVLPAQYPDKKILGILVPTIEQITGVDWKQTQPTMSTLGTATIGVIATPATVASGAFVEEINKRNPSLRVVQQACPGLVEAIEAGEDEAAIKALVQDFLQQLAAQIPVNAAPLSALLLGCTHYELIAKVIRSVLLPSVRLYEQPQIVAKSLAGYLQRHFEITGRLDQRGQRTFITTGKVGAVNAHSKRYFGSPIQFSSIRLV